MYGIAKGTKEERIKEGQASYCVGDREGKNQKQRFSGREGEKVGVKNLDLRGGKRACNCIEASEQTPCGSWQ